MPELPEVETIVQDLRPVLVGKKFLSISTEVKSMVLPQAGDYATAFGCKVLSLTRRGKFINVFLEKGFVITMHLRMSGRIIVVPKTTDLLNFERARLEFEGHSLRFCDQRKFGKIWLAPESEYKNLTGIKNLGIEPFDEDFDFEKFRDLFRKKRGTVKKNLLDQSIIAGIGNIYADESCFYSKIHPEAEMAGLNNAELKKLFSAVIKSLETGIKNRGTSISDYADAYGKKGMNQEVLMVYGRAGKPCLECETVLVKTKVAGRGTVFCPLCQKF